MCVYKKKMSAPGVACAAATSASVSTWDACCPAAAVLAEVGASVDELLSPGVRTAHIL